MSRTVPGLSLFSVGLCIAAGGPLAAVAAKPTEHTSEAGRYRAKFPGKPEQSAKDLSTGKQVVRVVTERSSGPRDLVFAVTYTDYPESYRDVPPKDILNGVRDGLKGKDGRVMLDEELEAAGDARAARKLRVDAGRNAVRANVYLVGSRLYQVMVTGPRDAIDHPAVGEFLASFEVVK